MLSRNSLYLGNCIEIMSTFPDESIDVIFADPPYNLSYKTALKRFDGSLYKGHKATVEETWDNFESFKAYDDFTLEWVAQARRILHNNGTIWVMGTYHNIYRVGYIMQNLGFWVLNEVLWIKRNPPPNFLGTRFTAAHETLLWCSKSQKSKPIFNYQDMKQYNDGKQLRDDWHLPICAGKERLRDSDGQKLHPTQKPIALLERVIRASTKPGSLILDPFLGSGTTALVAAQEGRDFVGIDQEPRYIKLTSNRLHTHSIEHDIVCMFGVEELLDHE